jgi:hypothetical protein
VKVKRFYYVASPRGRLLHQSTSITEGNKTYCGIALRLGWKWLHHYNTSPPATVLCVRCVRAMT